MTRPEMRTVVKWVIAGSLAASLLGGHFAAAQQKTVLPAETKGDPAPDTQQASSYLGQVRATEALLEARKFDAFNRMSAFVVHDLKNLVAQLVLLLKNAERHRNNPEFQRDMMATVAHAIERMNKLMLQLRTGTTPVQRPRAVDLGLVVQRACNAKANPEARWPRDDGRWTALPRAPRRSHLLPPFD